ncbi:hypothetical protein NHX12_013366 [Muraenolepis orangiensis]|uniref:Uncharacterized protein n=1 Tax=Muraenolepis orangiensis TaxID=630683 RepID=A0A9Q0I6C6_9TELE|nr:hypothetical protein NHX12_013366 [Muraenolepis orangiensis]
MSQLAHRREFPSNGHGSRTAQRTRTPGGGGGSYKCQEAGGLRPRIFAHSRSPPCPPRSTDPLFQSPEEPARATCQNGP